MQTRDLVLISLFAAIIVALGFVPPITLGFIPRRSPRSRSA